MRDSTAAEDSAEGVHGSGRAWGELPGKATAVGKRGGDAVQFPVRPRDEGRSIPEGGQQTRTDDLFQLVGLVWGGLEGRDTLSQFPTNSHLLSAPASANTDFQAKVLVRVRLGQGRQSLTVDGEAVSIELLVELEVPCADCTL